MTRPFTGRHIAAILIAFFGVVMTVNFTMAWFASATFGGLVVNNSYVASQKFNGWLERARAEKALGWTLAAERTGDHRIAVRLAGPVAGARVTALVRHPLGLAPERRMTFRAVGEGRYESVETLPAGRWVAHLHVAAQDAQLNRIVDLP